jgi:hypothetical protein
VGGVHDSGRSHVDAAVAAKTGDGLAGLGISGAFGDDLVPEPQGFHAIAAERIRRSPFRSQR